MNEMTFDTDGLSKYCLNCYEENTARISSRLNLKVQ